MNNLPARFQFQSRIIALALIIELCAGTLLLPGVAHAALTAETLTATNIGDTSATFRGNIGPSSSSGTITAWFEYGDSTSLGLTTSSETLQTAGGEISRSVTNLGENRTIYFRVVAEPTGSSGERVYGTIRSFVTGGSSGFNPNRDYFWTILSGATSKSTSVTFSAAVSRADATLWIEWGTSKSLGQKTSSITTAYPYRGYKFYVSGLTPKTKYYMRAAGTYKGTTRYSYISSFTTKSAGADGGDDDGGGSLPGEPSQPYQPSVITRDIIPIGQTGAILQGRATNPKSGEMSMWFQWGPSQSIENVTTPQRVSVNAYDFSATIGGLERGKRYYYRAVGQNSEGSTLGSLLTFIAGDSTSPQQTTLSAATGPLSFLTDTYATVTGSVQVGASPAIAHVLWGDTPELLKKTNNITLTRVGETVSVSETLSPLSPGKRYYYQVVAAEGSQVSKGIVRSFLSEQSGPTSPPVSVDGAKTSVVYRAENLTQESALAEAITASPGDQLRFAIKVTNSGTGTNKNIVVSTELPKDIAVSTIHNGGEQSDHTVKWNIASLAPKESATLQFDARASTANSDTVHTLIASAVSSVTNRTSNEVHVVLPGSPVTISVSEDPERVERGREVTYTFTVKNVASDDMLDGVLELTLPKDVTVVDKKDFSGGDPWKSEIGTLKSEKSAKRSIRVRVSDTAAATILSSIKFTYRFADGDATSISQDHTSTVVDASGSDPGAAMCGPSWWWWIITGLLFIALVISLLSRRTKGPKEITSDLPSINLPTYK